jgi:hypothetical protein
VATKPKKLRSRRSIWEDRPTPAVAHATLSRDIFFASTKRGAPSSPQRQQMPKAVITLLAL